MATLLLRALFIAAFCVATVGAAGFAETREPEALPLFLGGGAGILLFGLLLRVRARALIAAASAGELSESGLRGAVARIADSARALDAEKESSSASELVRRLDALLADCAALGNRNEDYMRALGMAAYTRVWDGFSTAERLLARSRSMAADGHLQGARLELTRARDFLADALGERHA